MPAFIDITGQKFGRLTAISATRTAGCKWCWKCRCDCGGSAIVQGGNLRSGHTTSCGCLQSEVTTVRNVTYGLSGLAEYRIWADMIKRCMNKNSNSYSRYGGRGIRVSEVWITDFAAFFAELGPRPSPSHSIDRIDVNGNYEPGNCKWSTMREQANNKRTTRFVSYQGETLPLMEVMRLTKSTVRPHTVRGRLDRGWKIERALKEATHA